MRIFDTESAPWRTRIIAALGTLIAIVLLKLAGVDDLIGWLVGAVFG